MAVTQQAKQIAQDNAEAAADQIEAYDTPEDCFWAYRTNLEDTLQEQGLADAWLPASEVYDDLWRTLTDHKIANIHC